MERFVQLSQVLDILDNEGDIVDEFRALKNKISDLNTIEAPPVALPEQEE